MQNAKNIFFVAFAQKRKTTQRGGLLFLNAEQVEPSFVFAKQMRIGCVSSPKVIWELAHKGPGVALFRKKKPPSSADDVHTVLDWERTKICI